MLGFWVVDSGSRVRNAVDRDVATWVLGSGGPVRMGSGFWVLVRMSSGFTPGRY